MKGSAGEVPAVLNIVETSELDTPMDFAMELHADANKNLINNAKLIRREIKDFVPHH